MAKRDFRRSTARALRNLHARERMRLAWYRRVLGVDPAQRDLRERKALHAAQLQDLLRKRGLSPACYAGLYGFIGRVLGRVSSWLPKQTQRRHEQTLERWLALRYRRFLQQLELERNLRTMVEAVQLNRLAHDEPGNDVIDALRRFLSETTALGTENSVQKTVAEPNP